MLAVVLPLAASAANASAADTKSAAETSENRALAETLFFTARGLMEAGRISEACVKLAESYRLDAAAGTLLNLAVCHEKEGKIASAWGEFREALADARKANRADREQLAKDHLAVVEPDLPMLSIEVPPNVKVPDLKITRNGVPLNDAAWATELPVDPGNVEIVASAPGYKPKTKTITIAKKQHMTTAIEPLELAPVELPPPVAPPFWTAKRRNGAILAGAGVVAAGVGTLFGVFALNNRTKSDDNCPLYDGARRCSQTGTDAMSNAKTDAWVADFGIGLGAVGIAVGAFLIATGGASTETGAPAEPKAGQARVGPWNFHMNAGPAGASGFVSRSF
jgi:hypothetical protein